MRPGESQIPGSGGCGDRSVRIQKGRVAGPADEVGTDPSDIFDDEALRQKIGSEFLGPAGLAKLDIRVTESVTVGRRLRRLGLPEAGEEPRNLLHWARRGAGLRPCAILRSFTSDLKSFARAASSGPRRIAEG